MIILTNLKQRLDFVLENPSISTKLKVSEILLPNGQYRYDNNGKIKLFPKPISKNFTYYKGIELDLYE